MILHLLKLVWHRKRTNALVIAEIFLSFLILFAVLTVALSSIIHWRTPLGYDWHDVWTVEVNEIMTKDQSVSRTTDEIPESEIAEARKTAVVVQRIIDELRTFPQVEGVAADAMTPFSENTWQTRLVIGGKGIDVKADNATDDFARVMRVPVLKGRWFSAEDDGSNYEPIIIDTDVARQMFGSADPVGQRFSAEHFTNTPGQDFRVVGVIAPYRKDGELSDTQMNMVFLRWSVNHATPPETRRVVVRVRPGTPASFETELNSRLRRIGAATFTIRRMEDMRTTALKMRLVPMTILGTIAFFLILMVGLGLTGVLWQTITRRTREIGLRRAVGASGGSVRSQVLGEVAVLSTLSVIAGAIVILQLPILGAFSIVTPGEFTAGFIAALIVIYAITLLCGAYPSWLASTIEPAEALRYE